jgi:ABC-type multidrug transport system ATPase subunit
LHKPQILLLDEPWSALDDRAIHLLSSLLRDAQARGCSVVVCSHQLREALEVATQVAVIDRGKLIFHGPNSDDFKSAPEDFYQQIS